VQPLPEIIECTAPLGGEKKSYTAYLIYHTILSLKYSIISQLHYIDLPVLKTVICEALKAIDASILHNLCNFMLKRVLQVIERNDVTDY
jgi:hypothetical protein